MKAFVFSLLVVLFMQTKLIGQVNEIKLDPVKVEKFLPYVQYKHSWGEGFEAWKSKNKLEYAQEMWYYTESFYIKRDYYKEGITLNEEIIYISRFEDQRKYDQEVIIQMPGFKDALVLIPGKNLIYKPN